MRDAVDTCGLLPAGASEQASHLLQGKNTHGFVQATALETTSDLSDEWITLFR